MSQSNSEEPTPLQKAEYAARRFAELNYRDSSAWSVIIRKTYGVRSLFKDLKSELVQSIVAEKGDEQIQDSIQVVSEGVRLAQFTTEEAYLIACSLEGGESL